jgi:dolichyl-phosphate beta-glucosyltransferase
LAATDLRHPSGVALSVIIPAYNEERRLPSYLARIVEYLEQRGILYEIIVVDDGSRDATAEIVAGWLPGDRRVRLIRLPRNRGKGHAVRTGMLQASGRLRLFTDADGATPIAELERLLKAIDAGADVAIASRALPADDCMVHAHLHRKVLGRVFSFIVNMAAVKGIRDTQCGFKLFTADAANAVFPLQRIDDFGFDVEVLFLCRQKGFSIAEVPVNWNDVPGSKVGMIRDSARMFVDIFRIRINDLLGAYRSEAESVK